MENLFMVNDKSNKGVLDRTQVAKKQGQKAIDVIERMFTLHTGIKHSRGLRLRLERALELKSDTEIMAWIKSVSLVSGRSELDALAEDLTNNETYFFRDFAQYECLRNQVLPELISKKRESQDKTIRIWSAACSTGEEAYSLAMLVVEYLMEVGLAYRESLNQFGFREGFNIKIMATDISRPVLAEAKNAIYTSGMLSSFRDFPEKYRQFINLRCIEKDRIEGIDVNSYTVSPAITKLVLFQQHNLNSSGLPISFNNFDVVFCRNVLIYMTDEAERNIIDKLSRSLSKDGVIFFSGVDHDTDPNMLEKLRIGGQLVYRRR